MTGDVRRSSIRGLLTSAAALLALAPAAFAGTVQPSPAPLSGSTFQGGDGDQDNPTGQPGVVDWDGRQALTPPVIHNPDDNVADTAFAGGSELLKPGEWELTTYGNGVDPGKNNIYDAWSAVEQPTPPAAQPAADTFLYLGFAREDGTGTAALTFELNRRAELWDNDNNSATPPIPCRTTGDLLIATLPHGTSANTVDIVLGRWETTAPADSRTSCARTGTVRTVATIPDGTAQGSMNVAGPITSRLGGFYAVNSPITTKGFTEVALNLSKLMAQVFDSPCFAFTSIWMHSRSSISTTSNMSDYVAPHAISLRTCSAAGAKFFDLNANGARDAGEPGLARFLIWADYDNDGVWDEGTEPFSVTDEDGNYRIDGINPPGGEYRLRETLATSANTRSTRTGWRCSYPRSGTPPDGFADGTGSRFRCGWGPISVARTPNAEGRDFGNWVPAHLTIEKRLFPAGSGTFDLKVNGQTVFAGAGDRDHVTLRLRPGSYDVTEVAAAGTDQAAFRSAVSCRAKTRLGGVVRPGTEWKGLVLAAGDQASCTFVNVLPGEPAIAIEKRGPEVVEAGSTIRYALDVTNPGDVAFRAGDVRVTDKGCDRPPRLISKHGDTSRGTLDPGDRWTFVCSHRTAPAGDDCVISDFTNEARVSASARGKTVSDEDDVQTTIECPDVPPEPPLPPDPEPQPGPDPLPSPGPEPGAPAEPGPPVEPSGPAPPVAGAGGVAAVSVSRARCITHASQVRLTGERMARIVVSVNGRRISTQKLRLLQRRTTPLTRLFSPGRHRLTIRITFERGAGTATVTLSRTITVCGPARQRVPGVTG
jgi:hypothetical protein